MIEFGATLRKAREAKGMSISDLSTATNMASSTIEELENENFERIPAPIYGRGFVKLYCEAVGLDPKPHVAEFMAIYNGDREPVIHERASVPPPTNSIPTTRNDDKPDAASDGPAGMETALPQSEPIGAQPAPIHNQDLFSAFTASQSDPNNDTEPKAITPSPEPLLPSPDAASKPTITRYAAVPQSRFEMHMARIPWRLLLLGLVALGLLLVTILGLRTLYRATTGTCAAVKPQNAVTQSGKPTQPASAKSPATATESATAKRPPRTPQTIPALYID